MWVKFRAGGTGAPAPIQVQSGYEIGERFPTEDANPVREGFRFTGWKTGVSGEGEPVTADFVVTNNIIVFAQWEEIVRHTVTFNLNGETIAGNSANVNTIVENGEAIGSDNMPVLDDRQGYALLGWKDGSGYRITADSEIREDITVYAVWDRTGLILSHNSITMRRGQIVTTFEICTPSEGPATVEGSPGLIVDTSIPNNPRISAARAGTYFLTITYNGIVMQVPVIVTN